MLFALMASKIFGGNEASAQMSGLSNANVSCRFKGCAILVEGGGGGEGKQEWILRNK